MMHPSTVFLLFVARIPSGFGGTRATWLPCLALFFSGGRPTRVLVPVLDDKTGRSNERMRIRRGVGASVATLRTPRLGR